MLDKIEAQSLVAERLAYVDKVKQYKYEAAILELTARANARIFKASIAGANCAIFYLLTVSELQKRVWAEFVRRFQTSEYDVYTAGSEYFQVVRICWKDTPAEVSPTPAVTTENQHEPSNNGQ